MAPGACGSAEAVCRWRSLQSRLCHLARHGLAVQGHQYCWLWSVAQLHTCICSCVCLWAAKMDAAPCGSCRVCSSALFTSQSLDALLCVCAGSSGHKLLQQGCSCDCLQLWIGCLRVCGIPAYLLSHCMHPWLAVVFPAWLGLGKLLDHSWPTDKVCLPCSLQHRGAFGCNVVYSHTTLWHSH